MEPFTQHTGVGVPLRRSNVDTDQIIPAVYLKRVTRTGFEDGLFAAWRGDENFILNSEPFRNGSVLVAGPDFGTGSSREHAVWALMDYGFKVVISARFADIFRGNSGKGGLVAGPDFGTGSSREHAVWALMDYGFKVVLSSRFADIFRSNAGKSGLLAAQLEQDAIESLWRAVECDPTTEVTVDLEAREVRAGDLVLPFQIDDYTRWRLLEGLDDIGITLSHEADIVAFEAGRPPWKPSTV